MLVRSNLIEKKYLWKIATALLLLLILGRFAVVGMAKVLNNTQSSDGDESAYLTLALDLREEGILSDGTRPPLYPLLLSPVAARSWDYFTWAKIITLGLGVLTVLAAFFAGKGLFSWKTGLLAAFLLASNKEFHLRASSIYADTLLVMTFLGAWYFLIKSFAQRRSLYLAGFFAGLAYLTKGSAPLLLGAWGLVALMRYKRKVLSHKELLIVPIVFLLTISPLLIYNFKVFGSPFYSFATTHVMWMDRWAESQVADPADLPTLSTYLQNHTPADMLARLQRGSAKLNPVLARTLIPSRSWKPPWLGNALLLSAAGILGLFLLFGRHYLLAYYRRHRITLHFSLILFLLFYLFSVWYAAVLVESRFLLPILAPFYILLADAFVSLLRFAGRRAFASQSAPWRWLYVVGLGLILAWGLWYLINSAWIERWSLTVNPFESDRNANIEQEEVLTWLEHTHPSEEANILFGPSKSLPLWKFERRFNIKRIPVDLDTWAKLNSAIDADKPDYIIIDSDTARRRRKALSNFFSYDEDEDRVGVRQIPPNWTWRHIFGDADCRWCVFSPAASPAHPLAADLGGVIEISGYDLEQTGRTLRLTLYWRSAAPAAQDYTAFLHLTAPDGFVKAQQDQQPFDGKLPTSRWQAGNVMADQFTIALDDSFQPGEYLLVTGMYSPQSGERLSVIDGPLAPQPDAVLLGAITLDE